MLKRTTKLNRVSITALIYAVLGLLCAAIILLATSFTVTAGTVDDAKNLGTEFDTTITDKTPTPYPDNIISMAYFRDSVFEGSTFSKLKFDEFIVTHTLANTLITLSNPRELLMFSAYCNGVEISNFAPTTINTTLMNHLLQSKFVLTNNIDYTGNETYYLDSTDLSKTVKIGRAGGSDSFTSNGIYDGYFDGSLIVPNHFLPIQNFKGSFDGQNFEIRNLIIMRNAKQNSTGIDAMFASVSAGGTVTSFGLVDTQFKRHNTYSNNVAVGGGNYALNTAAAIVGNNAGTVSYVYAVNTTLETVFDVFGAYNLPAVLIGVASEYYVGFTNGSTTYDSVNTNYTATATDTFGKRWYKIGASGENEAVFDNYFTNKYSAYARLSGFKADGKITGKSAITHTNAVMHEILRPVDFANMSRFVMENGGKSLLFRVVNDLDFRLVSDLAYISATSLNKTTSVLLFSDPNISVNTDGTFGIPNKTYTNSTNSASITNLKINAYLKSGSETVVGLFNQLVNDRTNDYNNPFEFINLNFINCIATPPVNDKGAAYVGFLAGAIRNGIGVINTLVNANIVAEDNTSIGGNTYYGGMIGSFLSINSNANKPFTNGTFFQRAAFKGTVLGGIRTHGGSYNTSFGGIFGHIEPSTDSTFNTVNVSGNITGIYPVASATNVKLQISVGGLMGYGKLGSTYQGVYISDQSVISNFPDNSTGINTVSKESHEIFVGGLVGRDRGGDATTFDAVLVDADIKLAGEYITPTDNNGAFTSDTTINIKAYYGGIAGGAGNTTVNNGSATLNVSQFFGGKFVMPAKDKVNRFIGFELYLGNLFGGMSFTKVYNFTNDKDLVLEFSRTRQLQVGGLLGTRTSGTNIVTNCHNNATVQLTMYSNDSISQQVSFNLGGVSAAEAEFTDCNNNGTVKISVDVISGGGAQTRAFGIGSHGSFNNCQNSGKVIYEAKSGGGNNQNASGISGSGTVTNCENTSTGVVQFIANGVSGGNFYAAGISSGGNVSYSQNLGTVKYDINGVTGGNFYATGISGDARVNNCDNLGNIHYNIANASGGNINSSGIVSTGTNMNSDSDYGVTNCVNGTKGMTSSSHTFTILNSDNTTTTGMNITVSGIAFGSKRANINNCINYSPINGVATTGTQYYAGISRQSGSVSQALNYGSITLGSYDSTNAIYIAGITNELLKPDDWNGIIYGTIAMRDNTNYGDISIASFRRNLFIGGVFNYTELNTCYSLANFGDITATSGEVDDTTSQIHIGGIFSHTRSNHSSAYVNDSMNFGNIDVTLVSKTHNAHGAWSVGGILGGNDGYGTNSVNAFHTLSNCINTGNITLNITNLSADANNYYTYGAGGILGVAYNRGVPTNDNYILNNCVNSGTITYIDNSNYTSTYELGGGAGGMIGNVNSVADYVTVNGALNYGAIKSNTNAGGIVGVTKGNNVNVNGAINYGSIGQATAGNSGGIFGRNDSGSVTLQDVVNYGTLLATNMGGIAAKNNAGSLSLNKAVYIDSTATLNRLVGVGSATYTDAYYASDDNTSVEQGVITKTVNGVATDTNWIYADNFMWGKAKTYNTKQTMVWSQKAYKSTSGYHATSITDTNSHCFALTNSFGTEKGEYLGNNYTLPSFIDSTHTALAQSKLADLKQISLSRDTYYTHGDNATHGLQLIDSSKQGVNSYLPAPLYNDGTKTFTSVIRPSSTYYGNNHGVGGFIYDGVHTDIASQVLNQNFYNDWNYAFSSSAKSIWKKGDTTIFNSAQENMPTLINIATFYLIVYQSDSTIADDTTKNIQEMETMLDATIGEDYYTTYTVRVYFFNEQDPTFLPDESVVDAFTYDNKLGTTALDTAAEGVGSSSGEEAYLEYKFETKPDKTPVIVNWDKGIFKGIFEVNGIEAQTVTDNGVFELVRVKDIYGNAVTEPAINLKDYPNIFTLENNITVTRIPDIEEELSTSSGTITVTIKFSDFNIIDEIQSGSYKLVIKLPKAFQSDGSVDYLERVITFDKEMSGDTYLKYGVSSGNQTSYNNKIANGEPNINLVARLVAYHTSNPSLYANSLVGRSYNLKTADGKNVSFVDIASTDSTSGKTITNYNPLVFDMDSSYYGTMPALPIRNGGVNASYNGIVTTSDPINFYNNGNNNRLVINPFATFSSSDDKLDIKFSRRNDGTYTITYSFGVVAENGDIGRYTQIYNFNQIPTMVYAADDPNSLAPDGKTISVGRTSSGTVSATYVGTLHNINDFISGTGYTMYIADADDKWQLSTHPMFDGQKLPIISVSGGKVMFAFERDTLGGKYSIVPNFSTNFYVPLEAYPDMVSFDGVTPSSGNWLNSFGINVDEGVLISKEASKNSHLRDFTFTNPPTGAKFAYIANNTAFPINESQTITNGALTLNYGTSRQPDPTTGERFNNFQVQLNYNAEGTIGGDETEYSTYMSILIKRWDKLPADEADIYNDEFVTIYTRDGTTLKDKLTVYKDDLASDYIEYRIYVAGGNITGLRVYAENTLFYTDYEFVTDGPIMNKTFNLTVNAPKDASGLFVISLKTLVGDRYTRTTNVLFLVGGGSGDTDITADLTTTADGVEYYTKTYRLTRNTAATYEATAVYPTAGYSHKLNSVSLMAGSGDVVLQTDLLRNRFTLINNDAATANIVVNLYLNADYKPPWGVGI